MLPEGPAAKALQEMTKPKRIAITDSFWLDLSCQCGVLSKSGFGELGLVLLMRERPKLS